MIMHKRSCFYCSIGNSRINTIYGMFTMIYLCCSIVIFINSGFNSFAMNLKTNYSLKLLLITLLLFDLISSCLSIQFNRVTYHNLDVFTTNSSSLLSRLLTLEDKLLTLGDNTLVFINGTRILSDSP